MSLPQSEIDKKLLSAYKGQLRTLSVRATNVLKLFSEEFTSEDLFIQKLLEINPSEVLQLKNCGVKTAHEILALVNYLRSNYDSLIIDNEENEQSLLGEETTNSDLSPLKPILYKKLFYVYKAQLPTLSIRASNILRSFSEKFPSSDLYIKQLLEMTPGEIRDFKNCGKKTFQEIMTLIDYLRAYESTANDSDDIDFQLLEEEDTPIPSEIDRLLPLIKLRTSELSERGKNGFLSLLEKNNNSLSDLYGNISSPSFKTISIDGIGKRTVKELEAFLDSLKNYLESFKDNQSIENTIIGYSNNESLLPQKSMEEILSLKSTLGYFPIFAAAKYHISELDNEKRNIIEGGIRIHDGQTILDKKIVGKKLGLSSERIRQKRDLIIKQLASYFRLFKSKEDIDLTPYLSFKTNLADRVNALEGTNFSISFISWVLSVVFDEITLVGNVRESLTNHYTNQSFLCIVPSNLTECFDFQSFIDDINTRINNKRINEESVALQAIISAHTNRKADEVTLQDITDVCRSILIMHCPVDLRNEQIIFTPNARKNNTVIVEDILRAAGHPLTLKEIYEQFTDKYPERSVKFDSFRGNINNNINIIPIGRSSTYALAEWNADEVRGGTIRSFVFEYLDSLQEPIAPAEEVGEYVRRFRPNASDYSIATNLMLEHHHKFLILLKNGIRYYSLNDREYDSSFKILSGQRPMKRTTQESMRLLEEFILRNGHYPRWNQSNEEEYRLYRFVGNRRSAVKRNSISQDEIEEWLEFENKYKEYDKNQKRKHKS